MKRREELQERSHFEVDAVKEYNKSMFLYIGVTCDKQSQKPGA